MLDSQTDPIQRLTRGSTALERAIILALVSVNLFGGLILASNRIEFEEMQWLMPVLGLPVLLACVVPFVGRTIRSDRLRARLSRLSQIDVCCLCGGKLGGHPQECTDCRRQAADATRVHLAKCRLLVAGAGWDDFVVEWQRRARTAGRSDADAAIATQPVRRRWHMGYGWASVIVVGAVAITMAVDGSTSFGRVAALVAMPIVVVVLLWAYLSRGTGR